MLATSSNGSQYSGSRVETPVSYVGDDDDDDDDEFNENDDDDWYFLPVDFFIFKIQQAAGINSRKRLSKIVPSRRYW